MRVRHEDERATVIDATKHDASEPTSYVLRNGERLLADGRVMRADGSVFRPSARGDADDAVTAAQKRHEEHVRSLYKGRA